MARICIIGSGAMGLAAAHQAAKDGHEVRVLEADSTPGGMAAHFDFDGLSIERFYHFVCKSDDATFAVMQDLGIADQMRWRGTSMGYVTGGALHSWGDPLSLLTFPKLDLISKLRYGALMWLSCKLNRWDALETQSAKDWIVKWCGPRVYDVLWRRLFELKFGRNEYNVSAAWIWQRIRRIGRSRRSLMQEELGYIEGGTETLVDALLRGIEAFGGTIDLKAAVREVKSTTGADGVARVTGVRTDRETFAADYVISTVPVQFVPKMVPGLPEASKQAYAAIQNSGVICVMFKLAQSVSPHFWVNIAEPQIEAAGIIEFSNLRRMADTIIYVPFYMPTDDERWAWTDERALDAAFAAIRHVNPAITESMVLGRRVGRLSHAQPICPPGFASMIPPVQTPIAGLQVADTCFYYPEDRGISESIRLGREMASAIPPVSGPRRETVSARATEQVA